MEEEELNNDVEFELESRPIAATPVNEARRVPLAFTRELLLAFFIPMLLGLLFKRVPELHVVPMPLVRLLLLGLLLMLLLWVWIVKPCLTGGEEVIVVRLLLRLL